MNKPFASSKEDVNGETQLKTTKTTKTVEKVAISVSICYGIWTKKEE